MRLPGCGFKPQPEPIEDYKNGSYKKLPISSLLGTQYQGLESVDHLIIPEHDTAAPYWDLSNVKKYFGMFRYVTIISYSLIMVSWIHFNILSQGQDTNSEYEGV